MENNLTHEYQLPRLFAKIIAFISIFLPLVMTIYAVLNWKNVNTSAIVIFLLMYLLTGFSISIGFHRYFAHRSFKCPRWLQYLLVIFGSMAAQGSLLHWVANHRKHHRFTDQDGDPYFFTLKNNNIFSKVRAFWHSHLGWILKSAPINYQRYALDIISDPVLNKISSWYPVWVLLGLIIPGIMAGICTHSFSGVLMGILWGGFVRICVLQQVTYSVNSICHLLGAKNHQQEDNSRDNWILGVLALGEGWHNSHHAFPTSARHGLRAWQFDLSYWSIVLLAKLGIVSNIKTPSPLPQGEADTRAACGG